MTDGLDLWLGDVDYLAINLGICLWSAAVAVAVTQLGHMLVTRLLGFTVIGCGIRIMFPWSHFVVLLFCYLAIVVVVNPQGIFG